jgi:serine/threonine protein phosphatase PrpC
VGIGSLQNLQQLNVIGCVLSTFTNELNKTPILVINAATNASLNNVPDEWKNVTQGIIQSPNSAISDLSSLYSKVVGNVAYLNARRKSMEDNFVIQHELPDMPGSTHVFAVFDGHAGPEAAAHCCVHTVPLVMKHVINEDKPKTIEIMMRETMLALAKFSTSEENPLSGATANLAFVVGEELYLACCGDVQTLIIEKNKAAFFSPTQTSEQSGERLRIQRIGGWVTEQGRVNGAINVSRCLGSMKYAPFVSGAFELVHRKITDDTSAMVMASDGLWAVMSPEEVLEVIIAVRKSTGGLKSAAIRLRDLAFQLGSADNITVLVVDFKCDD